LLPHEDVSNLSAGLIRVEQRDFFPLLRDYKATIHPASPATDAHKVDLRVILPDDYDASVNSIELPNRRLDLRPRRIVVLLLGRVRIGYAVIFCVKPSNG